MLNIGLTGGIGSGKSEVCRLFAAHGVPVIDADDIAHALLAAGSEGEKAIQQRYGDRVFKDGTLQRDALASIIFNDADEKQWLEAYLHPQIRAAMINACNADTNRHPYRILSIPLLVETLPHPEINRICVVDCPVSLQIARLRARDGLSDSAIQKRLQAQATRETRLAHADDRIENTSTLETLKMAVDALHAQYSQA